MQNIVSPSLALLLMLHYAFPSNLGVITLPLGMISPQACLASTTGRPSPWRPEEKLSLCKWSRRWQYLTSFILDCEASSAGNNSAFVRCPVTSVVTNRHRDWHHPTLEVLGFLRADWRKPIRTNMRFNHFSPASHEKVNHPATPPTPRTRSISFVPAQHVTPPLHVRIGPDYLVHKKWTKWNRIVKALHIICLW